MEQKQQIVDEENYSESEAAGTAEKKALVVPISKPKKNLDQTIRNPDQYLSWYHYNIKSIDKYMQLCPHCKKPSLSAFERSVVDSAIDYLNGKRMLRQAPVREAKFLPIITLFLAIGTAIYFLLNYLVVFIRS